MERGRAKSSNLICLEYSTYFAMSKIDYNHAGTLQFCSTGEPLKGQLSRLFLRFESGRCLNFLDCKIFVFFDSIVCHVFIESHVAPTVCNYVFSYAFGFYRALGERRRW